MEDQRQLAKATLDVLTRGQFESVQLIGSIATASYDDLSDIDLLIRDRRRSPRANVEMAAELLDREFGTSLRDWAGSLLPDKCLISLFLPQNPVFWYVDVGCHSDPNYPVLRRDEIFEDRDAHLAKLLIMNAKHYLRGNDARLRISDLYRKAVPDGNEAVSSSAKFQAVFDAIDYGALVPEMFEKSQSIIEAIRRSA